MKFHVKNKKPTVSIITACKNREHALRVSLMSWLCFDEVKEVIISDWSSDKPLNYLTKFDPRIKVIRVEDKKYFNQPQPLNLAASIATGDYIFKVDCDHVFNPYESPLKTNLPGSKEFFCGQLDTKRVSWFDDKTQTEYINTQMQRDDYSEYLWSYSPFYRYLIGMLYVKKEYFDSVGGYNEKLGDCYSYEDDELCERLELFGLKKNKAKVTSYEFIHLPHGDDKRIQNFKGLEDQEELQESLESNLSNYYDSENTRYQVVYALSQEQIKFNRDLIGKIENYRVENRTKWEVTQIDDQNYYAIQINEEIKPLKFPTVNYISLEESYDRRIELEKSFKHYGINFKSNISKRFDECDDRVAGKYVHTLNDGTKGCAVSHLKMIKDWYENTDEDYGFFAEDDLSLATLEYWNFTWDQFIEKTPEDADCIQLLTIRSNYSSMKIRRREWDDWGATAYILTRDYAKKILDTYVRGDEYFLEIPNSETQPLVENLIFCLGDTYTIPLFVENVKFISTFENRDDDVNNGGKNNHKIAAELVLNWWKNVNTNIVGKTELEDLLTKYSTDTENPDHNFNLGVYYFNNGHTAPALSYFLRCAERAKDINPTLAYEALIKGSYCYFIQGTRDHSGRGMLWQAQMFLPKRPEAYFLLARYAEKMQWWQDCYSTCELALMVCDFDLEPLRTDVEYPGKWGILYEKSLSAWWWGKESETRSLVRDIKENHYQDIKSKEHFKVIQDTLIKLATGYISEEELKYDKNRNQKLRFKFDGWEHVDKNYSQAFQDLFVLSALNGKKKGLYLEIGAQQPFYQNNTALLETKFGWDGISIEIRQDLCDQFFRERNNKILCADALTVDYEELLSKFDKGTVFDYLQVDCEPSETTYQILTKIPFDKYKFALITYEHDHYVDLTNTYKIKSREYLQSKGYKLMVPDLSLNENSSFEDWWYHPDLIDEIIIEKMKRTDDITDVRSYMIEVDK